MSSAPQIKPAAVSLAQLSFELMQLEDIEPVMAIENSVYPHPWSRGNFLDSLYGGYHSWVVREPSYQLAGYFLAMPAVDEMHLLNISVRRDLHGQGIGRKLLDRVVAISRDSKLSSVLLEVRPSNLRALDVYLRYGFVQIGLRKAYYPSANNVREDAIVMRLSL